MVALAPRYHPKLYELVRNLDDRGQPIAEVTRRVGAAAVEIGLFRPSYSHLRRVIHREREYADEIRAVIEDVAYRAVAGLRIDAYEVADRVHDARRKR